MEGVNLWTGIVFPYINLTIFIILFIKLFKNPLKASLSTRKEDYLKALQEASAAKQEALDKQKELDAKLAELDKDINRMRDNAKRQAEEDARQIVEQAKNLAANLRSEAEKISKTEVESARRGLQDEIIKAVREQVKKKLGQELSGEKHLQLVKKQLTEMPKELIARGT